MMMIVKVLPHHICPLQAPFTAPGAHESGGLGGTIYVSRSALCPQSPTEVDPVHTGGTSQWHVTISGKVTRLSLSQGGRSAGQLGHKGP